MSAAWKQTPDDAAVAADRDAVIPFGSGIVLLLRRLIRNWSSIVVHLLSHDAISRCNERRADAPELSSKSARWARTDHARAVVVGKKTCCAVLDSSPATFCRDSASLADSYVYAACA